MSPEEEIKKLREQRQAEARLQVSVFVCCFFVFPFGVACEPIFTLFGVPNLHTEGNQQYEVLSVQPASLCLW